MKRKFLEDLGIEKEVIDKIMDENGKDIETHKKDTESMTEKYTNLETELSNNKKTLEEANAKIVALNNMDIEGIKQSAEEWKQKYETFQEESEKQKKEFEQQLQQKDYDSSVLEYVSGHKFTSDFAKKSFINDFKTKEFKLENGKFLGADDYVKQFSESNPGVFASKDEKDDSGKKTYQYTPLGGTEDTDLSTTIAGAISGLM